MRVIACIALTLFVLSRANAEGHPRPADGADTDSIAQATDSIARRLKSEARYAESEAAYREGLSRLQAISSDDPRTTTTLIDGLKLNLCELYLQRGMYRAADEVLSDVTDQKSSAYRRRKANVLTYMGRYDEALKIYNRFINREYPLKAGDRWEIYANRGYLYAQIGQLVYAADDMQQAINSLGEGERDRYLIVANRSLVLARMGQYDQALAGIDSALVYFERQGTDGRAHADYIVTLRKRAEILLMMGEKAEAATAFIDYAEHERRRAVAEFATMNEQQRLDYWANKRPLLSEAFATEDARPEGLLDISLFRRETGLLGAADSADMSRRLSLRAADVRRQLKRGEVAVDYIRYMSVDSLWRYAALVAYPLADRRGVEFVRLWREDELHAYRVGSSSLRDAVCSTYANDKDAIYGDSTLAAYVWSPLLPKLSEAHRVYFCADGLLNMLAVEYLPLPALRNVELRRLSSLARLTRRDTASTASGGRLLAIGGLNYDATIPDTCTTADSHAAVSYLHDYIGRTGHYFTPLRGALREVQAIDTLSAIPVVLTTAETEGQLRSHLADHGYRAVHLSTHGYSLAIDVPDKPAADRDEITEDRSLLASGLALSGANTAYRHPQWHDGVLSARELCEMDLRHLNTVVLSSCQTAVGVVSDEGPTGMLRALKKAGVGTVMATLWEVDDEATRLLMTYYYQELARNPDGSRSRALGEAMRRLRELRVRVGYVFNPATLSAEPVYSDADEPLPGTTVVAPYDAPRYYAAFLIVDDNLAEVKR